MYYSYMCIGANMYYYQLLENAVSGLRQTYEYTSAQKSNDEYIQEIKDMLESGEDRVIMDLRWRVYQG